MEKKIFMTLADFLDRTQKSLIIQLKTDKLDFIKIQSSTLFKRLMKTKANHTLKRYLHNKIQDIYPKCRGKKLLELMTTKF